MMAITFNFLVTVLSDPVIKPQLSFSVFASKKSSPQNSPELRYNTLLGLLKSGKLILSRRVFQYSATVSC